MERASGHLGSTSGPAKSASLFYHRGITKACPLRGRFRIGGGYLQFRGLFRPDRLTLQRHRFRSNRSKTRGSWTAGIQSAAPINDSGESFSIDRVLIRTDRDRSCPIDCSKGTGSFTNSSICRSAPQLILTVKLGIDNISSNILKQSCTE